MTRILLLGAMLGAILLGGAAWATIPDDTGLYTACKLNATGTIRLVDPSGPSTSLLSRCTSYETKIVWNQKGGQPGSTESEQWNEVGDADGPAFGDPASIGSCRFPIPWANHLAGTNTVAFYKDPLGRVYLRGTATGGDCEIFFLPAGYRPVATENHAVASNGAFGLVAIQATGAVRVVVGSSTWLSLDGISFRAAS